MKTVSLKLSEAMDARLEALAKRTGQSKSAVARDALQTFFERKRGARRGSCFDLARDLAGCVRGPKDLSINKRHLRGYGR